MLKKNLNKMNEWKYRFATHNQWNNCYYQRVSNMLIIIIIIIIDIFTITVLPCLLSFTFILYSVSAAIHAHISSLCTWKHLLAGHIPRHWYKLFPCRQMFQWHKPKNSVVVWHAGTSQEQPIVCLLNAWYLSSAVAHSAVHQFTIVQFCVRTLFVWSSCLCHSFNLLIYFLIFYLTF